MNSVGPKSKKAQTEEMKRKQHNIDLLKRMKEGQGLEAYDSTMSWFPPRPIIKKDRKAIEKLYPSTPTSEEADVTKLTEKKDESIP